jgi:glucose/arabinose dehydrogenase
VTGIVYDQLFRCKTMTQRQRIFCFIVLSGIAAVLVGARGAAPIACDPDNGGITLPPGFCAVVVADNLGKARHLTVGVMVNGAAPNGDVYVALQRPRDGGSIVALRDADGDGKADIIERFGDPGGTGIAVHNGYLYFATPTSVLRYRMIPGQLKPNTTPETVVSDLPVQSQHQDKGIAFDGKGGLYINIGAPSNACQVRDRTGGSPGQDPCPLLEEHGGIWRFEENKTGQTLKDGQRYATGMRQMIALAWHDDALYAAMHGRDQLDTLWPSLFTTEQNAELPAETLLRVDRGSNFGWPYCYVDPTQNKLFLNPEYGGDGKKSDRCSTFTVPLTAFPAHWAPNDLMFYTGTQFPAKYRGGAFIAFHGSWNRAPMPQGGYNITFVPFRNGRPSGQYEIFADGFAGRTPLASPNVAVARPGGLVMATDGSVYVAEDQKGRIWRIFYRGN